MWTIYNVNNIYIIKKMFNNKKSYRSRLIANEFKINLILISQLNLNIL